MFRFFDLCALVILAIVVLMPKPGVTTKPALAGVDDAVRARTVWLERARVQRPADVTVATELADAYLRGRRPEWALQTLSPLRGQPDHRIGLGLAAAHAERYEFQEARAAVELAQAMCARDPSCKEAAQTRMALLRKSFDRIVAEGLSFDKDPHKVRDAILESLHNTKVPTPSP